MRDFYDILKKTLFFFLIVFTAVACRKDSESNGLDDKRRNGPVADTASRTLLVYMIAENNLNSYAYNNIQEMYDYITEAGNLARENNLLVYIDPQEADASNPEPGNVPRLMHITLDDKGNQRKDILKYYEERNSSSPAVMRSVIEDVCYYFPAEEYGLILWSHGLGWIPYEDNLIDFLYSGSVARSYAFSDSDTQYVDDMPLTKAFGQDGNNWMTNADMVDAIPDNLFDFIIFDACFMGSIEVLYELRNKADYFISSAAEILAEGFPYYGIMDLLLTPGNNYEQICEAYFEHYLNHEKGGSYKSATISLVKSSELEDLATAVRNIVQADKDVASNISLSTLQKLDRYNNRITFDLGDYIERISTASDYAEFVKALDKTVLYSANTTSFLGFTINKFSGLSIYVPSPYYDQYVNVHYEKLPWYDRVWK
ncbi:MAG: clostripain-related cysteine peptidase [Rikenellaceae bacterium]|nr:clostripain-related cysteine peptidase [Rikenellaceae bacterium]